MSSVRFDKVVNGKTRFISKICFLLDKCLVDYVKISVNIIVQMNPLFGVLLKKNFKQSARQKKNTLNLFDKKILSQPLSNEMSFNYKQNTL